MIEAADMRINVRELQHVYFFRCQAMIVVILIFVLLTGTFYKRKPLARAVSYQQLTVSFLGTS
jgi:hypothetical protein